MKTLLIILLLVPVHVFCQTFYYNKALNKSCVCITGDTVYTVKGTPPITDLCFKPNGANTFDSTLNVQIDWQYCIYYRTLASDSTTVIYTPCLPQFPGAGELITTTPHGNTHDQDVSYFLETLLSTTPLNVTLK